MNKLLSFLSKILGDYKEYGNGETYFVCPFCHDKQKFAINLNTMRWHCWICNAKGATLFSLSKRLDLSREQINELRDLLGTDAVKNYVPRNDHASTELFLPREYKPLWNSETTLMSRHALTYLHNRRISSIDIFKYQIGYCEEGVYANRIIIPSYDANNKLNYFIARSFFDDAWLKYMNPDTSKNVIVFENQINYSLPIVLCEGVFDAISIKRNAIPMLGKFIPKALEQKLLEERVKEVIVFLDSDAQNSAQILCKKLQGYGISVRNVVLEEGDAGEMLFDSVWKKIHVSSSPTFKDLIKTKLTRD
jgi:DNA primase